MNRSINMFYGANPQLFEYAKRLKRDETIAEKKLWERLSKKQLAGLKFRRQHPIKFFSADFYCHNLQLVIEVDGEIHNIPRQFEYDRNRDYELRELEITVLRFTNHEIMVDIESVIANIHAVVLNLSNQIVLSPPTP